MWIDQKFVVIEKILKDENGSLLDLGSRDQILKKFLPEKIVYTGVDISENKDTNNIIFDLNCYIFSISYFNIVSYRTYRPFLRV